MSRWLFNQPYLLVLCATLFWAGNAVAGKLAVGHISPFLLTSLRWLFAFLVVIPFALQHIKADWGVIKSKFLFLFALGAIGFTSFNNLMYLALTTTSAINVSIIQSALPLFIFLLNLLLFRIPVSKFQAIGFPISIIGVITITFQGSVDILLELKSNIGDGLMVVAVLAYGIYSVLLKNKPKLHWLSTLTVLAGSALIASIPFTLFEISSGAAIAPDITGLSVVLYTAVFASLAAQAFWIRSVELIGSNATGMFINLVPVFGSILAIILLGEKFYSFHAVGIFLIIGGVSIGQLKRNR